MAGADGTARFPGAVRLPGSQLVVVLLLAAASLDLARCSLVLMASRHHASAVWLIATGIGAAAASMTAARGCRAGRRWAVWAALLIGTASAPQASASGFQAPYAIPDAATAALGVLLTVAILATARTRGESPGHEVRKGAAGG